MKIWKSFGINSKVCIISTLVILILIVFINQKWALNFLFGTFLEAFNFFNQRIALSYILKKQKNVMIVHSILFLLRYFLFGVLLILYIFKSNPNIMVIFLGMILARINGIQIELNRLKEGEGHV